MSNRSYLLPPEIWNDILTKLPVKSILQCRSVCKSWYSLISCPNFISNYSKFQTLNSRLKHVVFKLYEHRTDFQSYSKSDDTGSTFYYGTDSIVGCSNGLIYLMKYDSGIFGTGTNGLCTITLLIWNPSIRKFVELPNSITYPFGTHYCPLVGFGFDPKSSDYKVLSVVCPFPFMGLGRRGSCQISELRQFGVWRDINPMDVWDLNVQGGHCCLNGALHWCAWSGCEGFQDGYGSERIVLSFDLSNEVFPEMSMPSGEQLANLVRTKRVSVLECHELLHVIVCGISESWEYPSPMSFTCSVWAMKEYGATESWTKLFSFDGNRFPPQGFWFWKNGGVLMTHYLEGNREVDEYKEKDFRYELVLYYPKSRKTKCVFSTNQSIVDVCFYTESLVLL